MDRRLELLALLQERDTRLRDEALALLNEARRQEAAAVEQAKSLAGYREDYRQRWTSHFAPQGSIEILQCYQNFARKLEQAITAQDGVVRQAGQRVKMAHDKLRHREIKLATVKRLIERRQQVLLRIADRRAQKALDESAQRRAWDRRRTESAW